MHQRAHRVRWIIAGLAALGAFWTTGRALQSARTADAMEGRRRSICVATRNLTLGVTPRAADCRLVAMRAASVPPHALRAPERLDASVMRETVLAGNVITDAHLVATQRSGDDLVPAPGTRIVQIAVSDGYVPTVGTVVDIYAAFSPETGARDASVSVVASRVRVVAAVTESATRAVRVLVSAEQARRIALARTAAALSVAVIAPEEAGGRSG